MDAYLQLAVAEGCGPALIARLLEARTDPIALLGDPPLDLPRVVRRRLADPTLRAQAAAIRRAAESAGLTIWTADDPAYPARLRDAPLRPLALFARGDPGAVDRERLAVTVVGSRTPTPYGIAAARDYCSALAAAGCTIWSGLAYGIDGVAHEMALDGGATTIAVLAGGLDAIHPVGHENLAARILESGGLWLSESPPGRRPTRGHFPRRNRILACAADAVLVVEAGERSGTMHTARFAADAGVPVFVVPGPYTSPRSRGCHRLLEDGADLAADPASMLQRLGVACALRGRSALALSLDLESDERRILDQLASGPRPLDLVLRETGLREERFLEVLIELVSRELVAHLDGDLLAVGRSRHP